MYELFELVHKDEAEVWSPIEKLGAVMPIVGEPLVGDFMAVQGDVSTFLCREVTRVKIAKLQGQNIQFEIGRGVPNWFEQAKNHLKVTPRGFFFQGRQLKEGDDLVYDGFFITVETPSAAETH